ncbi:formate dehydrogenase accessory sulfurtransferase FdhD [Runella limosa]|uniref:formate dehydrogenase accessory sulfurtransferase FdhD n=1 Tax=Runella limosa TaxID=370978 RepID=UPI0004266476|nr:formate dehydrogenase accessory sulfurtransferase FdhD [Runella limosa]
MNTKKVPILKVVTSTSKSEAVNDLVVVEEPLEIRIEYWDVVHGWVEKPISITMRTPGEDEALAGGFLFTEGLLKNDDIDSVTAHLDNTVTVKLKPHIRPDLQKLQRNFYATSSCGVCGKSSLDALGYSYESTAFGNVKMKASVVVSLPEKLSTFQRIFDQTGGIHAAGVFDEFGNMQLYAEDVGRHNAVDKIAGKARLTNTQTFQNHALVLSGRACFELLHKALALSIPIIVAVGAPSSLAIETAERYGQTLIGFTRDGRFNVYSGASRILVSE